MMTADQLISELDATGRMEVPVDVFDIDHRAKYGDATLGWRGDPSMHVRLNPLVTPALFEIWAVDRMGMPYCAASHYECSPVLLQKLAAGDPTKHDVMRETIARNDKLRADKRAKDLDKAREVADKIHFALRKDLGHLDGRTKRLYPVSDQKVGG